MGKKVINTLSPLIIYTSKFNVFKSGSDFFQFLIECNDTSLLTNLKDLFVSKWEYIKSIRVYPFNIGNFYTLFAYAGTIPIGDTHTSASAMGYQIVGSGNALTQEYYYGVRKIGEFTISRKFGNFLDFEPYTKAKIHIPYFNQLHELPLNEIIGKTITLTAGIDLFTGKMTVWLSDTDRVIDSWEENVTMELSVGATNANEIAKNEFNAFAGILTGTMNILGSGKGNLAMKEAGLLTSSGINLITGSQPHYSNKGASTGYMRLVSPDSIYIIMEYPTPVIQPSDAKFSDYAHIYGVPLEDVRSLNALSGFTKVGDIHFDPMGEDIYNDEMNEIVTLLRNGVVL